MHITHDLSACLKADQVILFEDGTNVESGTHEALLANPESKYRQFYNASLGRQHETGDDEDDSVDEAGTSTDADDEDSTTEESGEETSEASTPDDPKVPIVMHVSWFGEHDEHTGESPELYARIEEIHEHDNEEQGNLQVTVEDDEDEGNDSGFEASSQASFCPEESAASRDGAAMT